MPSDGAMQLLGAAVRNNADWCAAVCRSHGIPSSRTADAWWSPARTPVYYPDAVTLTPEVAADELLARVDTSPGCSVKDSFATLDLTGHGFVELFGARWIHRPAHLPVSATRLRVRQVRTPADLAEWQTWWHGPDAPDVFRPALLDEPSVLVLAVYNDHDERANGLVLHHGAGVVGVANLFTVAGSDPVEVWTAAVAAAAHRFPGVDLVGYEHGDDLAVALTCGFSPIGPLRVWLRPTHT